MRHISDAGGQGFKDVLQSLELATHRAKTDAHESHSEADIGNDTRREATGNETSHHIEQDGMRNKCERHDNEKEHHQLSHHKPHRYALPIF